MQIWYSEKYEAVATNYQSVRQNLIQMSAEVNRTRKDFCCRYESKVGNRAKRVVGIYRLNMKTKSNNYVQ